MTPVEEEHGRGVVQLLRNTEGAAVHHTRLKFGESLPNTKRVHCRRITRPGLLDHPTTAKRILAHA
jgi:hypothetical protein